MYVHSEACGMDFERKLLSIKINKCILGAEEVIFVIITALLQNENCKRQISS